jgi:HEAT repeat protein
LLVCLAALATLFALLAHNPEPRYQGRTLSEWHALWTKSVEHNDPQSQAQTAQAAHAIRAIGTNALPTLLRLLNQQRSPIRDKLEDFVDKLPDSVSENTFVQHLLEEKQGLEPTSTFFILGPLASPAVPQLAALLRATNTDADVCRAAAYCLAAIGEDGLPPLLDALKHPDLPACYYVAELLNTRPLHADNFNLGTNVDQAVPLLANTAMSINPELARASIQALGAFRSQPQIAIPVLTLSLESTNHPCRMSAVVALALFGPEGVGPLVGALSHKDPNVRAAATNCLQILAARFVRTGPPR